MHANFFGEATEGDIVSSLSPTIPITRRRFRGRKPYVIIANKIDRPNTTPTVRGICTFAVFFSVFRPFCRFTLVYEGHFVLCYKEKTRAVGSFYGKF